MNLTNSVKQKLDAGEKVFGCFIPLPSPEVVELIAIAGFDFALIDNEHGPITAESAYPMVLAAEARGIEAFARVGLGDRQEVLKFMDAGVSGVMAPRVNTADEARAAVAYTKYFTVGDRGLAGMRTFDYGMTKPLAEFVSPLNDRVLNMIQFEHVDTLQNLDAILEVLGVDVIFVGPSDLEQSLGMPGQPNHPDVTKIADEVVAKCQAAGVRTGTVAYSPELARSVMDRGFDMIVASATGLLGAAAKGYLAACKA